MFINHKFAPQIALLILVVFVAFFLFFISPNIQVKPEHRGKWDSLKDKSEIHKVMVTLYLNCKERTFGDDETECMLDALDYGDIVGIENASAAFNDMVDLSKQLASQE